MSSVRGLGVDSPFVELVGDPPIAALLTYMHESWVAYADLYKNAPPSFQKRKEPQLTQALAAYLRQRQDAGEQSFAGDFFGELADYVLEKSTGLPKCVARTDIEWRLHGVTGLIVEFKVLDGKKVRRDKYIIEGVMRFVGGRYASKATTGAMFALLRKGAVKDPELIMVELKTNAAGSQCTGVKAGSDILPAIATFDSAHQRTAPHLTPFQLAHLFAALPI